MAALLAAIRSVGAQPNTLRGRALTSVSHCCSWLLESAGPVNVRPGRNERSR
jgi:hypothetical protein